MNCPPMLTGPRMPLPRLATIAPTPRTVSTRCVLGERPRSRVSPVPSLSCTGNAGPGPRWRRPGRLSNRGSAPRDPRGAVFTVSDRLVGQRPRYWPVVTTWQLCDAVPRRSLEEESRLRALVSELRESGILSLFPECGLRGPGLSNAFATIADATDMRAMRGAPSRNSGVLCGVRDATTGDSSSVDGNRARRWCGPRRHMGDRGGAHNSSSRPRYRARLAHSERLDRGSGGCRHGSGRACPQRRDRSSRREWTRARSVQAVIGLLDDRVAMPFVQPALGDRPRAAGDLSCVPALLERSSPRRRCAPRRPGQARRAEE